MSSIASSTSGEEEDSDDQNAIVNEPAPSKIPKNPPKKKAAVKPKRGAKADPGKTAPKSKQPTAEYSDDDDHTLTIATAGLALHNVSVGDEDANQEPPPISNLAKMSLRDENGSSPELPKIQFKDGINLQEKRAGPNKTTGQNPTASAILIAAIRFIDDKRGASIIAIKKYVEAAYSGVDKKAFDPSLKMAIRRGIDTGLLTRPSSFAVERQYAMTGRLLLTNRSETTIGAFCDEDWLKPPKSDWGYGQEPSLPLPQEEPSKNPKMSVKMTAFQKVQQMSKPTSTVTRPSEKDSEESYDEEPEPKPEKAQKKTGSKIVTRPPEDYSDSEEQKSSDEESDYKPEKSQKKTTSKNPKVTKQKANKTTKSSDITDQPAGRSRKATKTASKPRTNPASVAVNKKQQNSVKSRSRSRDS